VNTGGLRRMQQLVQDVWALRGPDSAHHIGDLAWQRFQHVGREPLWRTQLLDEVLDWGDALETDALDSDVDAMAALERHGYVRASDDEPFFIHLVRELEERDEAVVPDGFVLRTVHEDDVEGRVEAHRSAFHPSRLTVESYGNVMRAWPYRKDLDCVAVAPDGRIAAYCLAWLDEDNRAGELEPVARTPTSGAAASRPRSRRSLCAAFAKRARTSQSCTRGAMPRIPHRSACTSRSASARERGRSSTARQRRWRL
jgi:hypothetical protein